MAFQLSAAKLISVCELSTYLCGATVEVGGEQRRYGVSGWSLGLKSLISKSLTSVSTSSIPRIYLPNKTINRLQICMVINFSGTSNEIEIPFTVYLTKNVTLTYLYRLILQST